MAEGGPQGHGANEDAQVRHFIVEFANAGHRHIMKSAGCDFTLFDLEHRGFGFETVKSALRYFEAADLPAIVRVPSREYHHNRARHGYGSGRAHAADGRQRR